ASAAIAIENARLYQVAVEKGRMERELQVAREVQTNLIPRVTPRIAGWDFAAQWHSALEVSGDFYDFIVTDGAPLSIVIGDVADKGMPAALFMTLTRTIMRASVGFGRTPAQTLTHANRLVCADASDGMFVTLLYAELDPTTGELCYANAGHPAPLWFRAASNDLVELTLHGPPLGVVETKTYAHEAAPLERGDVVLLYTDGVTDALNRAGEDFGKPRLLRVVTDSCRASARDVHGDLRRALVEFIGDTPPADDATFVVVRRME
ncbi:MAG: PP2C family protein-serine/threonine phosphatase, partial [Chloroflexota bacterium]